MNTYTDAKQFEDDSTDINNCTYKLRAKTARKISNRGLAIFNER